MTLPGKNDETFALTIPWDLQAIGDLIEQMQTLGQQQRWSPSLLHKAVLVVEELVVNALTYGGQQRNTGMVQIQLQEQADQLCIDIYDNGAAFDPLSLAEPDVDADLDSRGVGGLGVFLVRELSSVCRYERKDGMNHVHLSLVRDDDPGQRPHET